MDKIMRQKAFTQALEMMRARGYARAMSESSFEVCAYRSPVGPCFVGMLLPDELVSEHEGELENKSTRWVCEYISGAREVLGVESPEDVDFLCEFQVLHDNATSAEKFEEDAERFARRYDLVYVAKIGRGL